MKIGNLLVVLALFNIIFSICTGMPTWADQSVRVEVTRTRTSLNISTLTFTSMGTVTPISTSTSLPTSALIYTATSTSVPTATPINILTNTPTPTKIPIVIPTIMTTPSQLNQLEDNPKSDPIQSAPPNRTARVGLHGRNDIRFHELDYQLIRDAKIETLKMMSLTNPEVFAHIKQDNPNIEFIVRLYDDRINANGHPTPEEFVTRVIPIMENLRPYVTKFEIGNEPNHVHRYEGWGPEDKDAESFNKWFLEVYELLKDTHPWAELGFPGLGTPDTVHRHKVWLNLNREAINRADWLGVHCYWQTYPDGTGTMFDEDRGLCFKYYHEQFPDKPLEITEFDNDNIIWDIPPISDTDLAQEYITYYQELFKYPYIRSASSFIMSSPDHQWEYFVWRTEEGRIKPVITHVANMPRPSLAE